MLKTKRQVKKVTKKAIVKRAVKKAAKKVVRKSTPSVDPNRFVKTREYLDYAAIPTGTYFVGTIDKEKVEGLVYNDKDGEDIYFCQDTSDAGGNNLTDADLQGFRYGYCVGYEEDDTGVNVTFPEKPKGFKAPTRLDDIGEHAVSVHKGYIKVGCQKVDNESIRIIVKRLID